MADRTGVHTTSRGDAMQLHSGRPYYPLDPRPEDVDPDDVAVSLARVPRFNGHTTVRPYPVLEHLIRACDLSLFLDGWSPFEPERVPVQPPADGSPRVNSKSTSSLTKWLNSAARPKIDSCPASLFRVVRRARLCLVHDAAEHAIADITRPLKVNLPDYQRAEVPNDRACYTALAGAPPRVVASIVPIFPVEAPGSPWIKPLTDAPYVTFDEHAWVKHVDNLMLAAERAAVMRRESDGGLAWGDLPTPPACRATNLRSAYWSTERLARSPAVFDADADAEIARARLEIERKRLRTDGETIGEAEMAYFAAVEEARAIRLRVAWRERLDLLRVFDEIEQSERARDVWHGAP